jgi:hypothetical protein
MYTVLGFEIVFHKMIEENWKKLCVEISYLKNTSSTLGGEIES